MNWQIIALIGASLLMLAILLWRVFWPGKKPSRYPYQRRGLLFTTEERAFFLTLKMAVGADFEIFGKLRVSDIIVPKKGASARAIKDAFNSIQVCQFDFVLCEKNNTAIACVIQLNGKTHTTDPNEGDPLMPICENVGLPFVRFATHAEYSVEEVRDKLRKAISRENRLPVETDGRKEPRISGIDDMKF